MSEPGPIATIRTLHATLTPSGPGGGWQEAYRQDVGVLLAEIARLLSEVRRLTPAGKVARWGDGGATNYRYTVLRAGNNRTLAKYAYDEHHNRPPWLAVIGSDFARFATEPEARAHIETWAKAKGWEVRDGG